MQSFWQGMPLEHDMQCAHIVLGANGTLSVFLLFWYKGVASVAYLWIPCHLIPSDGFSVQEQLIDVTSSESELFS